MWLLAGASISCLIGLGQISLCSRRKFRVKAKEAHALNRQTVGFPDFQDQVVAEFRPFFSSLRTLQDALNSLTGAAYPELRSEQHLILNLGILAGTAMQEVVLLGVNGFGPGAMKAARSLLEAAVTAEYIRLFPEVYEDFREFVHVEKFKEVEFLREYLFATYSKLSEEGVVQQVNDEMGRVAARFGKRMTWHKDNLAERAKKTGYIESYRVVSPIASSFVHTTPYGLMKRFEAGDELRMGVASMSWLMQAFVSGHSLMLGTIHTLILSLAPEMEELFLALEGDYQQAWPPIEDIPS